jgi:hypothetical protein
MSTQFFRTAMMFLLIPMLTACSFFMSAPVPSQVDSEKEEQAVYAVFVRGGKGPALILEMTAIGTSTSDPKQILEYVTSGLPGISRETANSFLKRNEQPTQLSEDMQFGVNYVLLSADELAEISSQPNWHEILNEKYPASGGYTIFSRVGFNRTLDQAVIYVGNVAGPLMGAGYYYLLEKQDGEWVIKEEIMTWIS